MPHDLYQLDAFTDEPFRGNPAAVCVLKGPKPDAWMQALASEMNLSETAFLLPEGQGWHLRWFTPKAEVDLCGHATLASAMVLFETQPTLRPGPVRFQTRSGELSATWVDGRIELDFPAMLPDRPVSIDEPIKHALGFTPTQGVVSGDYFLFEAADEATIHTARPDFIALAKLPMPEVIITAISNDPQYDFISRFFAPQIGIDEDPVTGSAHCLLAPYWAEKLKKDSFTAYQASPRGGRLDLCLSGARVNIKGSAIFIFKASLLV